jgi:uncharacterized protein
MGLQSLIKFLLPKEDQFYVTLEKQGQLSFEVAQALADFSDPSKNNHDIAKRIQHLEHEGDKLVTSLEEELAKTFVTPIDREDLHKLSVELDDICDFCNQAARACVLFGIEHPTPAMTRMLNILVACTKHMNDVIPALRKQEFNEFFVVKGAIKELEKEADRIYREEISTLFNNATSAKSFISQKEVLDRLENAVDRCEDITQFLINLAVKHG